jgi:choline dehydrogenase
MAAFDYIVVGSGSAGAVVAARLSEDARNSVLLLEAGPDARGIWLRIPLGFGKVHYKNSISWGYQTEPEAELDGRRIFCSRGKLLGGSSAINGLIYVRGSPVDYAIWRQLGAVGWAYEDVLPYFLKAERQQRGPSEFHAVGGPLGVEDPAWQTELSEAFIEAAVATGMPRNPDFNGQSLAGAGYYQLTTWNGMRSSSAEAYLRPARSRRNLKVLTGALATRVEIEDRMATGVSYEVKGERHTALARREVILSGGSFNTPQLLQLSGIGPADLLRRMAIPVKVDLPGVGENLSDHLSVIRSFQVNSKHTINAQLRSPFGKAKALVQYALTRSGPLSIGAGVAGAFCGADEAMDAPKYQFFFAPFAASREKVGEMAAESSILLAGSLNRPASRGHVRITSPDPHDHPAVVPNYLSDPSDLRETIEIVRTIKRISQADPLKALIVKDTTGPLDVSDDKSIERFIREAGTTTFHHVGTCKMGTDRLSVVDNNLRVRGVDKLRVADGSIMPTVISGNTNAACIMIGERCADFINKENCVSY